MNLKNLVVDNTDNIESHIEDVSPSTGLERCVMKARRIQHLVNLHDNKLIDLEVMKDGVWNLGEEIEGELCGMALLEEDAKPLTPTDIYGFPMYSENRSHVPMHAHMILDMIDKQFTAAVDMYNAEKDDWVRIEQPDGTVEWARKSDESILEDEHFWNPANWKVNVPVYREKEVR